MKRSSQFWTDALPKIRRVVDRAGELGLLAGVDNRFLRDALTFTTAENDLDLDKLLSFEPGDFGHDVGGILNHSNYRGQFEGCFWPRCGSVKNVGTTSATVTNKTFITL